MVCRAYRTLWINAVGFCPCPLDMRNLVDLFDPDLAFPSWLNIQFWASWLRIKDSFLSDRISLAP